MLPVVRAEVVRICTAWGGEMRLHAARNEVLVGVAALPGFHLPLAELFAPA